MSNLVVRLRVLREAFAADREGRACYRRLKRELAEYTGPADGFDLASVASWYGAARGRTVRKILDRRST